MLPEAKISKEGFAFYNENLKIIVNQKVVSIRDLLSRVSTITALEKKCKLDLSNCKTDINKYYQEKANKEVIL